MIKFIDHDNSSRVTMDYKSGELLIDKIRATPKMSKETMFSWFYSLLVQLIQFHKCYPHRQYRYLNPFSVLITKENELYLLDMEASSNQFVLKNLQTQAMRVHFLKPNLNSNEESKIAYDIYCFGKTLQFILAHSEPSPSLRKSEELKLVKLIEKCLGENPKKRYSNFWQIKKEISFAKRGEKEKENFLKSGVVKRVCLVLLVLVVGVVLLVTERSKVSLNDENGVVSEEGVGKGAGSEKNGENMGSNDGSGSIKREEGVENRGSGDDREIEEGMESEEAELDVLDEVIRELEKGVAELLATLHENDKEGNERIIHSGQEMERMLLRVLATAYDRENHKEKAISAYGRWIEVESREEYLELAYLRKMKLEGELGLFEQSFETGRRGLERMEGNVNIARLYLESLIDSEMLKAKEIEVEYLRLLEIIPELENDEIVERLQEMLLESESEEFNVMFIERMDEE